MYDYFGLFLLKSINRQWYTDISVVLDKIQTEMYEDHSSAEWNNVWFCFRQKCQKKWLDKYSLLYRGRKRPSQATTVVQQNTPCGCESAVGWHWSHQDKKQRKDVGSMKKCRSTLKTSQSKKNCAQKDNTERTPATSSVSAIAFAKQVWRWGGPLLHNQREVKKNKRSRSPVSSAGPLSTRRFLFGSLATDLLFSRLLILE